jgi:hypothetical protein
MRRVKVVSFELDEYWVQIDYEPPLPPPPGSDLEEITQQKTGPFETEEAASEYGRTIASEE